MERGFTRYPDLKMLESLLEEKFNLGVRKLGGMPIKLAPSRAGLPDRLVVLPGWIAFVELKQEGFKPSPIQKVIHRKLRSLGAIVYVVAGQEELTAWLEEIEECSRARPA